MSYCQWTVSVVRRQQYALNDISSAAARPRDLIFGIKHCLVIFYQVSSNGGTVVQNGPTAWNLRFKKGIYLKFFFSRIAWIRCFKFGMYHCLIVLYQVCSTQGPRAQDGPAPGVGGGGIGSNHRNTLNAFKNLLLQNHLACMFEIMNVALPSGPLLSLFK